MLNKLIISSLSLLALASAPVFGEGTSGSLTGGAKVPSEYVELLENSIKNNCEDSGVKAGNYAKVESATKPCITSIKNEKCYGMADAYDKYGSGDTGGVTTPAADEDAMATTQISANSNYFNAATNFQISQQCSADAASIRSACKKTLGQLTTLQYLNNESNDNNSESWQENQRKAIKCAGGVFNAVNDQVIQKTQEDTAPGYGPVHDATQIALKAQAGAQGYKEFGDRSCEIKARMSEDPNALSDCKKGWFERNQDVLLAGGAGLAAGGLLGYALGSGGDDSKSKNNNSGGGSSGGTITTTPTTTASTGFTPAACTGATDYNNSSCDTTFVSQCTTNPAAPNCALFANRYCGLGNGTDAGGGYTPSGSGSGNGSAFCRNTVGSRFCQSSGRNQCPTCQYMAQTSLPICQSQPNLCVAQNTADNLNAQKSSCPSDPYYAGIASPLVSASVASNLPAGNASAATGASAAAVPQANANAATFASVRSIASGGSVTLSSVTSGNAAPSAPKVLPGLDQTLQNQNTLDNSIPSGMVQVPAQFPTYRGPASEIRRSVGQGLFAAQSGLIREYCRTAHCEIQAGALTPAASQAR